MYGCCPITLTNKQPSTVNGSPESILDRAVRRASRITGSWASEIAEAVDGLEDAKQIRRALKRIEKELDVEELEGALAEADLHAGMLGALDAHYEAETEHVVKPVRFKASEFVWLCEEAVPQHFGGNFASRGIDQAVGAFNRLEVLRVDSLREAYEKLDQQAIRHAFWVSGETRKAMLQLVRKELARQIHKGADLRDFRKWAKARLESAGWAPKNPSHVETIFRTNVLRAYNAGRAVQMQHPTVLTARPIWRITGPNDNRKRAKHKAVLGWELYASDEGWREAYPPFGFNCRERVTSRRTATGTVHDGDELLQYVPDPGFRSGLKGLIIPPGPKPPKNHPKLTPEVRPKVLPKSVEVPVAELPLPPSAPPDPPPRPKSKRPKGPKFQPDPITPKPPTPEVKDAPLDEAKRKKLGASMATRLESHMESRRSREHKKAVREGLRAQVEAATGLRVGDDGDGKDDFRTLARIPGGAQGYHDWDGGITIDAKVAKGAAQAFKKIGAGEKLEAQELTNLNVFLHEELHGFSRIADTAYEGHGMPFEEALNETLSRHAVRKLTGQTVTRGAYADMTKHVARSSWEALQTSGKNLSPEDADKWVAETAVAMRKANAHRRITSADQHIREFVKAGEGLTDEGREQLLKVLLDRKRWARMTEFLEE